MVALVAAFALFQLRPPKEQVDALNAGQALHSQGKYLAAINVLEKLPRDDKPNEPSLVSQVLAWFHSAAGNTEESMRLFDGPVTDGENTSIPKALAELDDAKAEPALDAIVRQSKNRQIVILNEAHHVPRCRAFALQLAQRLRRAGFEYFAAETFTVSAETAFANKVVTRNMGNYTREPMFGDLIRQVEKLGFSPVWYEAERYSRKGDSTDQINERESQEAENISNRLFKPHPKARVFIYCGYDHATKGWEKLKDGRDYAWMAARLQKLTGIDPLSIDQTYEIPHSRPGMESPEYRYASSKGLLRGPTVFEKPSGKFATFGPEFAGQVDMQVFHPFSPTKDGRPIWTRIDGYRRPVSIPISAVPLQGRLLVQAFCMNPNDEIPVDQVIVEARRPTPKLMLTKGRFRLVLQDEVGVSREFGEIQAR